MGNVEIVKIRNDSNYEALPGGGGGGGGGVPDPLFP